MDSKRLKILVYPTRLFLDLMKRGFDRPVRVINPIPEDSIFVRIFQEGCFGNMHMVIASESFPELNDGDEIPRIKNPEFEVIFNSDMLEEVKS